MYVTFGCIITGSLCSTVLCCPVWQLVVKQLQTVNCEINEQLLLLILLLREESGRKGMGDEGREKERIAIHSGNITVTVMSVVW